MVSCSALKGNTITSRWQSSPFLRTCQNENRIFSLSWRILGAFWTIFAFRRALPVPARASEGILRHFPALKSDKNEGECKKMRRFVADNPKSRTFALGSRHADAHQKFCPLNRVSFSSNIANLTNSEGHCVSSVLPAFRAHGLGNTAHHLPDTPFPTLRAHPA